MVSIIFSLFTLCIVWLLKAIYHSTYWRRLNVPGPRSLPIFGNLLTVGWNDICYSNIISKWSKKYGGYYGFQKGSINFLVMSDPKLVKEVLVEKFNVFHTRREVPINGEPNELSAIGVFSVGGRRWKRFRSILNPFFSTKSLKQLMPTMYDTADRMLEHMDKKNKPDTSLDITPFFCEATLDMTLRALFGQEASKQFQNQLSHELSNSLRNANSILSNLSWMFPHLWRPLYDLQKLKSSQNKRGLAAGACILQELIEERKKMKDTLEKSEESRDLIDLLLETETNEVQIEKTVIYNAAEVKVERKMSIDEILSTCVVFLQAGPEASARTAGFAVYFMAKNPDMQGKLRDEIERVCPNPEPSYEQLGEMKYAELFIKETLRLEPHASAVITRRCAQDTTLSNGVFIKAGTGIEIDVPSLHRNKEVWGDDANEFRPERFLEPSLTEQNYAFGGGPRICIGMRMAFLIQKIFLVKLLQRYRFRLADDTDNFTYFGPLTYGVDKMKVMVEVL